MQILHKSYFNFIVLYGLFASQLVNCFVWNFTSHYMCLKSFSTALLHTVKPQLNKKNDVKVMHVKCTISHADIMVKIKKAQEWLVKKRCNVKVEVVLRGREKIHTENAQRVLTVVRDNLANFGRTGEIRMNNPGLFSMVVNPKKLEKPRVPKEVIHY
eukprot:GHVL01045055.1.p1 GENE.GHVL01045055.1~~GHVL01045055.1.p1  ORF type:complete len:157 (+),score=11.09 GHVL01045055.1:113-583(+)